MWSFGLHAYARVASCTRSSIYRQGRSYSSEKNGWSTTKPRWKIFSTVKKTLIAVFGMKLFVKEALQHRGVIDALLDSAMFHVIGPKKIKPKLSFEGQQNQIYQPLTARDEARLLILEPGGMLRLPSQ